MVTTVNAGGESADSTVANATTPFATAPDIDLSITNGLLTLCWLSNYIELVVQYRTNLLEGNWQEVFGSELTNVFNYGTTTNDSLFFRLINP